ncbi:MAG TPA: hypothetical protein VGJ94_04005 [Syntrophorhabdaceae bacterium]
MKRLKLFLLIITLLLPVITAMSCVVATYPDDVYYSTPYRYRYYYYGAPYGYYYYGHPYGYHHYYPYRYYP